MARQVRVAGVIEGFYGPPWSHAERLDLIRFCGEHGLDTWVHAPKDDPYHRKLWREPYPEAELAQLGELVTAAQRAGVDLAYAIAPGLSICCSRAADFEALVGKCEQVRSVGVRSFQLLWDDVEHTLNCPEDEERYRGAERPSGAAQRELSNRFREAVAQPGPLVVCPMGYAGTGPTPYRRSFGDGLHPEIVVYWTGPEVVSLAITRRELDAAARSFGGHELLVWDNYPVNDFDVDRLFLGPLTGRDPALADGRCAGLIANAMVQATPSKLALATVADWCRDPTGYDPLASFEQALLRHGAEVVESLHRLAGTRRASDPGRTPDLAALVELLEPGVDAATGAALLERFV